MPKTNDATGATYKDNEGIVQHGAPIDGGRVLSQLDPERNLDGTFIEGEHPDRDTDVQPKEYVAVSEPTPIEREDEEDAPEDAPEEEPAKEESTDKGAENKDRSVAYSTNTPEKPVDPKVSTARASRGSK